MSEEYDLKKSENKIGQLYPILKSKDGQIIDGFHRKDADPNWKTLVVPEIDNEEKLLLARLIANFHRRQISREEKEKWINGLAKIYKNQGLRIFVKYSSSSQPQNEIGQKLVEVTGLTRSTIDVYLDNEYKQPEEEGAGRPAMPIIEKAESALGREGLKKLRKQVLEEAKLTPQERAALTRKRHQEKEERLLKRKENKRLKEEKLQKQAEERAKNLKTEELLKDDEFLGEATKKFVEKQKLKSEEEARKTLEELGIPPVGKQIEEFYEKLPPAKPQKEKPIQQSELAKHILSMLQTQKLKCPICGETEIGWKCGHEFK